LGTEHNKPEAAVHPERMPTGPKKEEEDTLWKKLIKKEIIKRYTWNRRNVL
jgi:hypothetical protein